MTTPADLRPFVDVLVWWGALSALVMAGAVATERLVIGYLLARQRRLEKRYGEVVQRARAGDADAERVLAQSPRRHRIAIAWLLVEPLIKDRDPGHIAHARDVMRAMALFPAVVDRYLRSRLWWRRALAVRTCGVLQITNRTASIVAALDDANPDVRGAALDALADLRDPASLQAVVVRLHDASLHRGRRLAALASFGHLAETFVLDLAQVNPEHRVNYARALALCGSERSRPVLCEWTDDARADVRAAALEALAHVGLDDHSATLAVRALDSPDALVRSMAARALRGWEGPGEAASHLARHLDDTWVVAVQAARSLQQMPCTGLMELQTLATRSDLAGLLARQMLWEASAQH